MDELRQDLRQALRALRRAPGFTLVAVLALALGVGAVTTIFTLVDAALLRPLPVADPARLVGFGDPAAVGAVASGPQRTDLFSYPLYADLRARARRVSALVAVGRAGRLEARVPHASMPTGAAGAAAGAGGAATVRAAFVSGNYFAALGVRAAAGRALAEADDREGAAAPVAVLSDAFWRRRFARDPGAVGRTLVVNGAALTVVGVAPPGFTGETVGWAPDLWVPLTAQPLVMPFENRLRDRTTSWLTLIGRLAPGATVAQAGAELTALARQSIADAAGGRLPAESARARVDAWPGARGFSRAREQFRGPLAILFAATGLVLLVVCANVANLLLARAAARRAEVSLRLALGAGRGRLVRLLLTETALLGLAAGALGLLLAWGGSALLVRTAASGSSLSLAVRPDLRVLAFAAALSLATAALVGLVPARRAAGVDLAGALRANARTLAGGALGGGRRLGVGGMLVTAQVALSLVLLVGGGLLVQSVRNLQRSPVGLARDRLLLVDVDARAAADTGERFHALTRRVADAVARVPGARAATYSENGIFSGSEGFTTLRVDGFVARTARDSGANFDKVGPGYFAAIGARLLRGREFGPGDDARAPRVAVVNQTMARFYFGGRDPVGQYVHVDSASYQIVGVVADVTDHSLRAEPARRLYLAMAQGSPVGELVYAVRTAGDPARAAARVRQAVLAADPRLRVTGADPLTVLMRQSIAQERLLARLGGVAGGMTLVLAALGLYGVMTYATVRRGGEFGVRLALGARPGDVTRLVLRESLALVAAGAALGVPAALGAARLVRHQLVGVGVVDVPTLAGALAVLGATAAFAAYRPARRAARVAPQAALRDG
jgi:predicted permease